MTIKQLLINDEPCGVYITDTHVTGFELIIDDINHVKPKEQSTSPFTVWCND